MSARVIRTACVIGLITTVGVAGVANAGKRPKPKPIPPVCNLVSDPTPDGFQIYPGSVDPRLGAVPGQGQDDALDIVTADVATDAKNLTTVIRMRKTATSTTSSPTGLQWQFTFTVDGTQLFTSVTTDPVNGTQGTFGFFDKTLKSFSIAGTAAATVDTAKGEVRVTVPLASFAAPTAAHGANTPIKRGGKLETMSATVSGGLVVNSPAPIPVPVLGTISGTLLTNPYPDGDIDASDKTYTAGTPSCVKIGA